MPEADDGYYEVCPVCGGEGRWLIRSEFMGGVAETYLDPCWKCKGRGIVRQVDADALRAEIKSRVALVLERIR